MPIQRKTPPTPVAWDQHNILARLRDLEAASTSFVKSTTNPSSDSSAALVRNIRDHELINHLYGIHEVLNRIHAQLSLITDTEIKVGEII